MRTYFKSTNHNAGVGRSCSKPKFQTKGGTLLYHFTNMDPVEQLTVLVTLKNYVGGQ